VRIAREALAAVGSTLDPERLVSTLGFGDRQIVDLARALLGDVKALLLDEPTAFLDIKHQVAAYDLVRRLNRETKVTVLAVSHDVNLAGLYSDRLLLFKTGGIHRDGSPPEVLTPANLEAVYQTKVVLAHDPQLGLKWMVPIGEEARKPNSGH